MLLNFYFWRKNPPPRQSLFKKGCEQFLISWPLLFEKFTPAYLSKEKLTILCFYCALYSDVWRASPPLFNPPTQRGLGVSEDAQRKKFIPRIFYHFISSLSPSKQVESPAKNNPVVLFYQEVDSKILEFFNFNF